MTHPVVLIFICVFLRACLSIFTTLAMQGDSRVFVLCCVVLLLLEVCVLDIEARFTGGFSSLSGTLGAGRINSFGNFGNKPFVFKPVHHLPPSKPVYQPQPFRPGYQSLPPTSPVHYPFGAGSPPSRQSVHYPFRAGPPPPIPVIQRHVYPSSPKPLMPIHVYPPSPKPSMPKHVYPSSPKPLMPIHVYPLSPKPIQQLVYPTTVKPNYQKPYNGPLSPNINYYDKSRWATRPYYVHYPNDQTRIPIKHYNYQPPTGIMHSNQRYPVYTELLPLYVYKYRRSLSRYSDLLTGLALYNLGRTSANLHSKQYFTNFTAQSNELCKFGIRYKDGYAEEMVIDCQVITDIIYGMNKQTNTKPITRTEKETVINNTIHVVVSNQAPVLNNSNYTSMAITPMLVNVSTNDKTFINSTIAPVNTTFSKNITTIISSKIEKNSVTDNSSTSPTSPTIFTPTVILKSVTSNGNLTMTGNFILTNMSSSTTNKEIMTLTTVPAVDISKTIVELTPASIDKAPTPGVNTSLAVQNISISNEISNASKSAGLSRLKRDTVTTNTMTSTTIAEINPLDSKYYEDPIQLTHIKECYIKRIVNNFADKQTLPCSLLRAYTEQSFRPTANFGLRILSSLNIIIFVQILAFILQIIIY